MRDALALALALSAFPCAAQEPLADLVLIWEDQFIMTEQSPIPSPIDTQSPESVATYITTMRPDVCIATATLLADHGEFAACITAQMDVEITVAYPNSLNARPAH